jgi:hypothetical protein
MDITNSPMATSLVFAQHKSRAGGDRTHDRGIMSPLL